MVGHNGASTFLHAEVARCSLGETGVAILGMTRSGAFPLSAVSVGTETSSNRNIVKSFTAGTFAAAFFGSSPGNFSSQFTTVVLRV